MITLIGTGHVFNLTQALLHIFDENKPDLLCVELDKQRYNSMMLKQRDPEAYEKASKNVHFLYRLLARFQDSMAKEYGVTPGEEMLTTINYAQSHNLPLAFIDMNAQNLFRNMLKKMSVTEKFKLVFSGFAGLFVSKKHVESELSKIDNDFDSYINQVAGKFPTIKQVLIDDRNNFMANHIIDATEKYENIISVVGDGHIPGMSKILDEKNVKYQIIRLKDLRSGKYDSDDTSSASFSLEYEPF